MTGTENSPTKIDKLAVIRKLLAKAEGAATSEERDSYNAKANELIARYGIDQALLAAEGKIRDTVGSRTITIEAPYSLDKRSLLAAVYEPLGCKTIRMVGLGERGQTVVQVYGYDTDLERAEILYTSLLIQATRGALREAPQGYSASRTAANRRAWLSGFTVVIRQRLEAVAARAVRDAQDEATSAGVSTALVLVDRSKAVESAYKTAHPRVRNSRRILTGSGYGAGQAAGHRADIGGKRVGGQRTAIG